MKVNTHLQENAIGKTIKQQRLAKGWTQSDMATRLFISVPAFSKIESGITTVSLKRLGQISEVLDVSIQHFMSAERESAEIAMLFEIDDLKAQIALKEGEISNLQQVTIKLYEELRQTNKLRKTENKQ